jgi:hypothetical protein
MQNGVALLVVMGRLDQPPDRVEVLFLAAAVVALEVTFHQLTL